MVYDTHRPRPSDDDRLVDRFTRRETAAQRARRLARTRIDVPEEVIIEFEQRLNKDTAREARAIAQALTHTPTGDRTMATTKRNATTRKADPTPVTPKREPKVTKPTKPAKKAKAVQKTKTAKPTDRASILAKYKTGKLQAQKRVKIGETIVYHGRNTVLDGNKVKVVGHESLGGVFVTFRDTRYVVSPHALLKKADTEKKS